MGLGGSESPEPRKPSRLRCFPQLVPQALHVWEAKGMRSAHLGGGALWWGCTWGQSLVLAGEPGTASPGFPLPFLVQLCALPSGRFLLRFTREAKHPPPWGWPTSLCGMLLPLGGLVQKEGTVLVVTVIRSDTIGGLWWTESRKAVVQQWLESRKRRPTSDTTCRHTTDFCGELTQFHKTSSVIA